MMKVLHIIHSLGMGGAQRLLSDMLPVMNETIEAHLLVTHPVNNEFTKKLKSYGLNIISLNVKSIYNPVILFKIIRIIKQYDVVHAHLFPSLYFVALASIFSRTPIVYTEHSTFNNRRKKRECRFIEKYIYNRFNVIISISQQTQEQLENWLGLDGRNKFVVVNNGIDLSSFKPIIQNAPMHHTLIMISRFVPAKDQATVIRSMTYLPLNIKLIFVGSGETLHQCQELSKKLELTDRIQFAGNQSDVASWIAKATIGIQSSNWEGFGLTAVEMMAGGLPVIASDVEGLKQIVENAGIIFPCGDEKILARKINQLIENTDYYRLIRNRCLERAKKFDIRFMIDKYIEVYQALCNNIR